MAVIHQAQEAPREPTRSRLRLSRAIKAQQAPREPVRPRLHLTRAIVALAILGLAALGAYQLVLMAEAVKLAAASAWSTAVPDLGAAWHALQGVGQAVAQAATHVH